MSLEVISWARAAPSHALTVQRYIVTVQVGDISTPGVGREAGEFMDSRVGRFLTYLDREAPMMGILCGFCLAVLGLIWKEVGTAGQDSLFHDIQQQPWSLIPVAVGSASLLWAAALFYRQRSRLLTIYGKICLNAPEGIAEEEQLAKWRREIEYCWQFYQPAFGWMGIGFFCIFLALVAPLFSRLSTGSPANPPLQPTIGNVAPN